VAEREHQLPVLGVGITYSPAVEPLLFQQPQLFNVVEVEPQTVWLKTRNRVPPYRVSAEVMDHIAQLSGRKIVHSIGTPVGGTVRPEPAQLELLLETIRWLDAPWLSDHLSFNSTPEFNTGFFLPPRQTREGVETVVRSIRDLQEALPVPIAVETGVNYLRPRADEMPDGHFVAAVVDASDCGLLLDLHNVFTNAINGRQAVDEFLAQIPLERVWEVHIAGGFELEGYWLDAHSGAIPEPLFEIANRVIPALPNLKAIIFEIFPSFIPVIGLDIVRAQIERLHELWSLRGQTVENELPREGNQPVILPEVAGTATPAAWEQALGGLVIGREPTDDIGQELKDDNAVRIVNHLIREFRASMIVNVLKLSSRLMMLALGPDSFRVILESFWSQVPPQQFASVEAEAFADYLSQLDLKVPPLAKILEYERAVLSTLLDDQTRVIHFDFNPIPLLRALADGRLPDEPGEKGNFEIEITADGDVSAFSYGMGQATQIIPFH
jgi:uncharacterized protein (UPF0276 family)